MNLSLPEKVRNPIKGLRQKVRTALRQGGVTNKFGTDIMRNGNIVLFTKEIFDLPFKEYDGRKIVFILKE